MRSRSVGSNYGFSFSLHEDHLLSNQLQGLTQNFLLIRKQVQTSRVDAFVSAVSMLSTSTFFKVVPV